MQSLTEEIMETGSTTRPTYILDLQTQKTFEDVGGKKGTSQMGISFAALLKHNTDEIKVYTETDINTLLDEIFSSYLIVGLNLKKFAYKVLSGYRNSDFEGVKSLDILEYIRKKIIRRLSINDLFLGTLGINKSIDNMKIARLYKEKKIEEVKQITIQNVKALNSVYSFGKQKGYVFINDRAGQRWKISVCW
jgi:DEAD/DEAH box helicase domain-containing protein